MWRRMYSENINEIRNLSAHAENADGVGKKKLDFRFYWNALLGNKWLIIFFTALMTSAAVVYSLLAVPIYAASATLLLESQKANIISIEDLVTSEQDSLDYYGTQYAVLKSRALTERVLERLVYSDDLSQKQLGEILAPASPKGPATIRLGEKSSSAEGEDSTSTLSDGGKNEAMNLADLLGDVGYNNVVNRFRKSLSISPVVRTKLVTITYKSTDPEYSMIVANAVASQYIENATEQRKLIKENASDWMDSRIQELKYKLEDSEEVLFSFKKANGLMDLNGDVGLLSDRQLLFVSSEFEKAKSELSDARDLYIKTQTYKTSSPDLLETLPYVQNNVAVRSAKADLEKGQRDLVSLRNRYGEKHPAVIDAQSTITSLRLTLDKNIEGTVAAFENDYQLLQQRVVSLEESVAESKDSVQSLVQQKVTLDTLKREAAANRDQYNRLFDRITEIRTTDGLDEANAVLSEAAWIPTNPVKPDRVLIVGIVMLASLFFAAAVSFIKEYLDDTVNTKADIESRLSSRILGIIPKVEPSISQRRYDNLLTTSQAADTSRTFLESVNTCRTSLWISGEKKLKVMLVTSSVPNEGKSTVALNLANSFGQLERTLLIDCDLRRPSIAATIGMQYDEVGLTNLLIGKSVKPGSIQCAVWNSFDCLTSGPVPDNPQELIASAKFAKGLRTLRSHYDRIIIDSPSILVVSDAIVLSQLVDKVVYVVKPHETPIKLVGNGLSRLAEVGASVAGVCISQMDINSSKSCADMDFHGFGMDFKGYGKYFAQK